MELLDSHLVTCVEGLSRQERSRVFRWHRRFVQKVASLEASPSEVGGSLLEVAFPHFLLSGGFRHQVRFALGELPISSGPNERVVESDTEETE